jgi:Glucose / Sorbosone dehydrogenase
MTNTPQSDHPGREPESRRAGSVLRVALVLVALLAVILITRPPSAPAGVERRPVAGGPVLLHDGLSLRKVTETGPGNVKLSLNPMDGQLYFLNPGAGIYRVAPTGPTEPVQVVSPEAFQGNWPAGMTIGPDGAVYVVLNGQVGSNQTHAVILRGEGLAAGNVTWHTLASTQPYPLSATPFDHMFNGITVSPDGQSVIVNSGSRTDHGEVEDNHGAFPNTRDVALTAKIYQLPANAGDMVLPNNLDALNAMGVIYASGTRNSFDPEFAPNGDLFAGDNGPDADFPDELNWLRPGLHYGFPWRFGNQDNPQRFANYDPANDHRLSMDFTAVQIGAYHNDPEYPPPPGPFTDPVTNLGPAAMQYRAADGTQHDAAQEGIPLYTFTPHRSPLGLVFTTDSRMPPDLAGDDRTLSAFILSWGAAGGTLTDKGQDLLHLSLTQRGDAYFATTTQIAREFQNPIDAVMIGNRLYVLEFGGAGAIWELTFN